MKILTLEQFNYNLKIIGERHERKGICTVFNPSKDYRVVNLNHALGNQPEAAQNNINYLFLRELRLIGCRLILTDNKNNFVHPILEPIHDHAIDQCLFRNKDYLERNMPELASIRSKECQSDGAEFKYPVTVPDNRGDLINQLGYQGPELTFRAAGKIATVILNLGITEYRFVQC